MFPVAQITTLYNRNGQQYPAPTRLYTRQHLQPHSQESTDNDNATYDHHHANATIPSTNPEASCCHRRSRQQHDRFTVRALIEVKPLDAFPHPPPFSTRAISTFSLVRRMQYHRFSSFFGSGKSRS